MNINGKKTSGTTSWSDGKNPEETSSEKYMNLGSC